MRRFPKRRAPRAPVPRILPAHPAAARPPGTARAAAARLRPVPACRDCADLAGTMTGTGVCRAVPGAAPGAEADTVSRNGPGPTPHTTTIRLPSPASSGSSNAMTLSPTGLPTRAVADDAGRQRGASPPRPSGWCGGGKMGCVTGSAAPRTPLGIPSTTPRPCTSLLSRRAWKSMPYSRNYPM